LSKLNEFPDIYDVRNQKCFGLYLYAVEFIYFMQLGQTFAFKTAFNSLKGGFILGTSLCIKVKILHNIYCILPALWCDDSLCYIM